MHPNNLRVLRLFLLATLPLAFASPALAVPPASLTGDERRIFDALDDQTRAAVGAELESCSDCSLELLPDRTPNVIVHTRDPRASVSTAPPPFSAGPPTGDACQPSNPTFVKSATYYWPVGNDLAGVYYRVKADAWTEPTDPGQRRHSAHTENAVGGSLIGFSFESCAHRS